MCKPGLHLFNQNSTNYSTNELNDSKGFKRLVYTFNLFRINTENLFYFLQYIRFNQKCKLIFVKYCYYYKTWLNFRLNLVYKVYTKNKKTRSFTTGFC